METMRHTQSDGSVEESVRNGREVLRLQNGRIELEIVPELGARIVSLKRSDSSRQWLWKHPTKSHWKKNQLGDSFADSPLMGIDECVPTVLACEHKERLLPDHGEVWSQPWALNREAIKQGILETKIALQISPFTLTRSLSLSRDTVHFSYCLQNIGKKPEACLWCFHPVFSIETGDRIELPQEVREVLVSQRLNLPEKWMSGDSWPWPKPSESGPNLAEMNLGGHAESYAKAFAKMRDGDLSIRNETQGERLRLQYDSRQLPALGIWICRGGWLEAHQVALEPSHAAVNALDELDEESLKSLSIPAGGSCRWKLSLSIEEICNR